jgi:hypothetical protein
VKKISRPKKKKEKKKRVDLTVIAKQTYESRQRVSAMKQVNDLVSLLLGKETCGQVEAEKPKDVFRLLSENINSLGVFSAGETGGNKLRQTRYLLNKWNVDMASFVETQAGWRHADEGHQFENLLVCGGVRHSVAAYNFTAKRILSP